MEKRRYELSDEQWHQIEPFFPTYRTGQPSRHDNRTMFNALLYVARSGSPWRDLPAYYLYWKSVYTKFCRWRDNGLLNDLFMALNDDPDLENLMIDSTIVPAHQHSAGSKKGPISKLARAGAEKPPKSTLQLIPQAIHFIFY